MNNRKLFTITCRGMILLWLLVALCYIGSEEWGIGAGALIGAYMNNLLLKWFRGDW